MSFSNQPPWLTAAWAELGQHESPGAATNPRIAALFAEAGHPEVTRDEVAWCAAFVGACLRRGGLQPSGSLLARSYQAWGDDSRSRLGAIAVLSRGDDPELGHVGFVVGETADALILLGGNQQDAVGVAAFARSRLVGLRWPSGGADPAAGPLFDRALAHVLDMEGGFSDDPADPGGPTNYGVTLADYARSRGATISDANHADLVAELKHIAPAVVRAIYLDRYWRPSGCPDLPAPLAFFHFDTAVNMGTGTAIRMLQTALGCGVDGEIGPLTVTAAATADVASVLGAYADLRRRRYRSLAAFPRFGRGWLTRVDTTLARALALTRSSDLPHPTGVPAMTDQPTPQQLPAPAKWWGQSMTIWGAIVAGLAAVLPAAAPAIGVEISADTVHTSADQLAAIAQAAAGLAGTLAAILGRLRARQPLAQRTLTLKL